jgi:hypothetical protein
VGDVEAGLVLDVDGEAATQGEQRRDTCRRGGWPRFFPAGAAGCGNPIEGLERGTRPRTSAGWSQVAVRPCGSF